MENTTGGPDGTRKARPRRPDSLAAEAAFRRRLKELGADLLEPEWLGAQQKHRVRCREGHACCPKPASIQQGQGICRTCAGRDPSTAEAAFRARVAELGAEMLGPYINHSTPVHVRCTAGHDCYPWPTSVQQGRGVCLACAGKDPVAAEAAFRSRLTELGAVPLYDAWRGAMRGHHVRCANGHESYPRPNDVQQGDGICRTCAGRDSVAAEAAFRARLTGLGAVPLYPEWLGVGAPHRARCAAGHDCYPWPNSVQQGGGICRTCSGTDPAACEAKFRARLKELGAVPLYQTWLGSGMPHPVRCAAGHACRPRPGDVLQGHGACRMCACREWDVFYVVASSRVVKFGISSGDPRPRLRTHAAQGYTRVVRLATGLPGGAALDAEDAVKAALTLARERPVQGKEYFDLSCLALILDVADSWLRTADTQTGCEAVAEIATTWMQEELFAA